MARTPRAPRGQPLGYPQLMGRGGDELAIDQIGCRALAFVTLGGHDIAAPVRYATQARFAHQFCYAVFTHLRPMRIMGRHRHIAQLSVNLVRTMALWP